jgi:hypothetical protein
MTLPPPPRAASTAATARILHAGLTASAAMLTGLSWFFRGTFLLPEGTGGPVTFAAYALAASGLLAGLAFRRLIPERGTSQDADGWWRQQLPKAAAVWAIGEGTVLLGALVLAVGGQLVAAFAVVLAGFAVLMATAPGRLVS